MFEWLHDNSSSGMENPSAFRGVPPGTLHRACQAFLKAHASVVALGSESLSPVGERRPLDLKALELARNRRLSALQEVRDVACTNAAAALMKTDVLLEVYDWLSCEDPIVGEFAITVIREIRPILKAAIIEETTSKATSPSLYLSRSQWLERFTGRGRGRRSQT